MTRRILTITAIFVMMNSLFLGNVCNAIGPEYDAGLDAKVGDTFAGIPWGANISSIPNMQKTATSLEGIETYVKSGDNLKFEGLTLSRIEYGFVNGRLSAVTLRTKGAENWNVLKSWAFGKYGAVTKVLNDERIEEYGWQGKKVNITLNLYHSSGEGWLVIINGKSSDTIPNSK